jgi:hypothetical protein
MKKILVAVMFGLLSLTAFAEASFDEIQGLINSKNYAAAEAGLEVIIKNHPNSAKAFYAMAEAQAGLGNLEKANKALNLAKGIDPTLKFVSEGSVRSLEQAITPQTAKITYEEPSHFWRNLLLILAVGIIAYILHRFLVRKYDTGDGGSIYGYSEPPQGPSPITPSAKKEVKDTPVIRPAYKGTTQTKATETPAQSAPSPAPVATPVYHSQPAPTTTVINNSSNDGFLTGMIVGNMMSNSHHDHTTVIEREVVRETPSRSSSWDDTPARSSSSSSSSRSSSWDDDSSSSKSSSWDDSSSSRSSSWDSDSSSSSSSWDSSSSDSSSSSDW